MDGQNAPRSAFSCRILIGSAVNPLAELSFIIGRRAIKSPAIHLFAVSGTDNGRRHMLGLHRGLAAKILLRVICVAAMSTACPLLLRLLPSCCAKTTDERGQNLP